TGAAKAEGGYNVTIKNIGGNAAPTNLVITYTDGSSETLHQTAAIWRADPSQATVKVQTSKPIKSIDLDGGIWMDADPDNDKWTSK
ncbi:MAG TPA: hypothetical protein VL501_04050, partial [Pyrinomonadaceae bacterium]|nr:hypothetical protein [Pyrinomonadaceae bacterium]